MPYWLAVNIQTASADLLHYGIVFVLLVMLVGLLKTSAWTRRERLSLYLQPNRSSFTLTERVGRENLFTGCRNLAFAGATGLEKRLFREFF